MFWQKALTKMKTTFVLVSQMFRVGPMGPYAGNDCTLLIRNIVQATEIKNYVCSKSISIIVNLGTPDEESLTLIRGKRVETARNSAFTARYAGLYVFIDTKIGVTLQWDKGTHLILKVTGEHSGKVEGLCGNYDQNSKNDFKTSGTFMVTYHSVIVQKFTLSNRWFGSWRFPYYGRILASGNV